MANNANNNTDAAIEMLEENTTVFEEIEEADDLPTDYVVIGLGNCGNSIVSEIAMRKALDDVILYAIDSTTTSVSLNNTNRVTYIPIISDEKAGSGRNRERGGEMYQYHEDLGDFEQMYETCMNAKNPVIVITSAAGGTGSGSTPKLCKMLTDMDIHVIPIIVCPALEDPDAYHLNNNDLFLELEEAGIKTYAVFRNIAGDANYTPINKQIVDMVEIMLGRKYEDTNLDSIDDSDLDAILSMPGRIMAVSAKATDTQNLTRQLTKELFAGYQPAWTEEDADKYTFMTAYSLKSMFASQDFYNVFEEVRARVPHYIDEYRNIVQTDNGGESEAVVIVAGLPRPEVKRVISTYNQAGGISAGMTKSTRPDFMGRKKSSSFGRGKTKAVDRFSWNKKN